MLARRAGLIVLGAALLGLGGCDHRDDSLTGVWTGAFRDNLGGLGGGNLTFTQQSGAVVQGSWSAFFKTFGALAKFNNSGALTGTLDGDTIAGMLSSQGPCSFSFQATRSGLQMSGTYAAVNCAFVETGSFDLEKQ